MTEIFPLLIFISVGSMIDFRPLLQRPWMLIFGIVAHGGIFIAAFIAYQFFGFSIKEAASIGVAIQEGEMAMRCNLICVQDGKIKNHSAGHISNEEAKELIEYLQAELGNDVFTFHNGISYRHLLIMKGGNKQITCTPPHDVPGTEVEKVLVKADNADAENTAKLLNELILKSQELLENHPVNLKRKAAGKDPANSIWVWSPGYKPSMKTMIEKFGIGSGAVISAVDLIKGIGIYAGLESIEVEGATGLYNTNYEGKAEAAINALKENDFVFIGAHPMAGLHLSGFEHSTAKIFNNSSMILTPYEDTPWGYINTIKELFLKIGFTNIQMSTPDEHDKIIAFTSQLAHIVSNAYVKSPNALIHKGFSAGSYKDLTRVAYLNENMWSELFLENRDNLINEIDGIIAELKKYSDAIKNNDEKELEKLLSEGSKIKAEVSLGSISVADLCRPHTAAILGFPTDLLAGDGESASRSFCGLLGLGVLDFIKTHIYHFLSFLYLNYSTDFWICQEFFLKLWDF